MAKNNKEIRDIYFEYYRTKRSREFMDQHDSWKSWLELKEKIERKRNRRVARRISVAATVAVLVAFAAYLRVVYVHEEREPVTVAVSYSFPEMKSNKAILLFDDGTRVDLTKQSGRIDVDESMAEISNVDRQLVYKSTEAAVTEVKYNTLSVPRGGEYQLVLSDGTKVWVNAESSLRYPESFGDRREVMLSGEAYFEVAKDAARPFIVQVGDNSIEVLGTHFNVSSYEEDRMYTTLAEGKVKVSHAGQSVILHPNEQAMIRPEVSGIGVREVDASLYTSWIKGRFEFRDTELGDIAAQLSRWYDVEIRFADESLKNKRFAGIVYRDEELGFSIEIIERVANVQFVRKDNVIYIDHPK